jgi:hypothetical protein
MRDATIISRIVVGIISVIFSLTASFLWFEIKGILTEKNNIEGLNHSLVKAIQGSNKPCQIKK